MGHDILNSCKKFVVQKIMYPNVYWMTEYENGKLKSQVKLLECLLANNVEKIKGGDIVPVGSMVAVKNKTDFNRGVVTYIFGKKTKTVYFLLLVDYGKMIETTEENLYFIKSKDLRNRQFGAFEVTIQGIQPSVLELDYENHFRNGLFRKRVCYTWSVSAVKFVQDLLRKNPHVFVKALHKKKWKISGEIYFVDDSCKEPVSLAQVLCNKGFSVFCNTKTNQKDALKGEINTCIEEKIPKNAFFRDGKGSEKEKAQTGVDKDKNETEKISISGSMRRHFKAQSEASAFSSTLTLFNSENSSSNKTEPKAGAVCYSPSWMLKKCSSLSTLSSPDNSPKPKHF